MFSGGGLSRLSLFALGIMPYITASIILQVLTPVSANLQALQKEGELGQRRITQYTRYLTVALAALQGLGYTYAFHSGALGTSGTTGNLVDVQHRQRDPRDAHADGGRDAADVDGRAGHPARHRQRHVAADLRLDPDERTGRDQRLVERLELREAVAAARDLPVVLAVVYVQEGIRKIPIQYAKRMVGRRMTSGGSTYLPLRINMAGVIPVIFAAAIMAFPATVAQLMPFNVAHDMAAFFTPGGWPFLIGEAVLIFAFTFFYVAVVFNSIEQADNLKKAGGFIPGIRPGRPTAQYLESVLVRLTVAGGAFLAAVAVLPSLFIRYGGFSQATSRALGGTTVLIVVGVAIDTMRQIEAQLAQRSYQGFLK